MVSRLRFLLPILCLVVCSQTSGGQQPSTVTLRPGTAASQPGVPTVRVTVDRPRVPLGTRSTFSLAPASIVNDRRYIVTLYFGDGQRQVMSQPQVTHTYLTVGTYTYAVDVRQRQAPPCNPRVTLNATPNAVAEAQPVSFSAQLSEPCPNTQYRFFYGDGSSSNWQSSPQAQHNYPRAGRYLAYVDINDGTRRVGGSTRTRVDVTRRADPLTLSLSAQPLMARSGRPVTFTATPSEQRPGTRYQFNFGDGNRSRWQSDPQASHTYRRDGRYRAYAQISQNNLNPIATSPLLTIVSAPDSSVGPIQQPTPTPAPRTSPSPGVNPSPSPDGSPTPPNGSASPGGSPAPRNGSSSPGGLNSGGTNNGPSDSDPLNLLRESSRRRWWYLLIAALLLLAIYQASGYLFAAQPTFTPFPDPGVAAVGQEKGAAPFGLELLLEPNVSTGDYSVVTDAPRLVTNGPPAEERQVIEI
jgi:hypothetical protein